MCSSIPRITYRFQFLFQLRITGGNKNDHKGRIGKDSEGDISRSCL